MTVSVHSRRSLLEAAAEQMHEPMLVLDTAHLIVELNAAAGKILSGRIARLERPSALQLFPALARSGVFQDAQDISSRIVCPGAEIEGRHYAICVSPLVDSNLAHSGHVVVLWDVTALIACERRRADQQTAVGMLQERERVARELHDNLGQVLAFLKVQAEAVRRTAAKGHAPEVDGCLSRLVAAAQAAEVDVREYIAGAHATASLNGSFASTLKETVRQFGDISGLVTTLNASKEFDGHPFEAVVEAQLLRIVQEALTNVRKHAHAKTVSISCSIRPGAAEAIVHDDGVGCDPATLDTRGGQHFGLIFMRERAEAIGGTVRIRSAPGEGTAIIIRVPLRRKETL